MIQGKVEDGKLVIPLEGSVSSSNAAELQEQILSLLAAHPCGAVELDCDRLAYCSSAGLRVILRVKRQIADTVLTNVHPDLYSIFDMTGFTQIMEVRKAYRVISVEGCEVIGQGANGLVYRIDPDTIVKVYKNANALPEIQRERELAKLAFMAGVPTAISYDVARIEGGGYGSVFELLNAESFASLLIRGEKTVEEAAQMSVSLLKHMHAQIVPPDTLPSMKATALDWVQFLRDHLAPELYDKLFALVSAVPDSMCMLHGDYHAKNLMLQDGEILLIDMDTICHGHPVFELAGMYNAYAGFFQASPAESAMFLGLPPEICWKLWRRSLELYLDTTDKEAVDAVEAKARIIGLARMMRREIRRDGENREDGRKAIEYCRAGLAELLPITDTLVF